MASDREAGGGDLGNKGYFRVGSHIKCRYQGGEVEGEVAAFQSSYRLLVIRSPPSNGKASASNVYLINADCVCGISVDDRPTPEHLRPIDFHKLGKRREKSIGTKKARIRALAADVTPEGKKLFLAITKTIDEVTWDGSVIVVLNEVRISSPYKVENVEGEKEASVVHIKKIVEKYWKEQEDTA